MKTASKHKSRFEVELTDFTGGVCTVLGPSEIPENCLRDALNIKHSRTKGLRTRDGLTQVSNTALPAAANITAMTFYNDQYILAGDDNNLYYLDATYDPILIGVLSGVPHFVEFNDTLIICDGGVARYYNSVATYGFITGPKALFGVVRSNRLYLGGDEDNPSRLWFSNVNDPNDFTTEREAGYIDIDPGDGGILVSLQLLGDLIIIIKDGERRSIHQLAGEIPDEFDRTALVEGISGINRNLIINGGGDIFLGSREGIISLKTYMINHKLDEAIITNYIQDIYQTYFNSSAYMGHCYEDSQVWLQLSGYAKIFTYDLLTGAWFPYQFKVPWASFAYTNGFTHIGGQDGHLYRLDITKIDDDDIAFDIYVKTWFYDFKSWRTKLMKRMRFFASARMGCTGNLKIYINSDGSNEILTEAFQLSISDDMLVDDADMLVADADFLIDSSFEELWNKRINFRFKNVSFGIEDIVIDTYPAYIRGFMISAALLGSL